MRVIRKILFLIVSCCIVNFAHAATIVATVNEKPITDLDITNRIRIMPPSLNNREAAKNAIIDDILRLEYAEQFRIAPTDKEVNDAMKEHKDNPQMRLAIRANLAWQMVIMRTIIPTITIEPDDIKHEFADLQRERGLPERVDFILLNTVSPEVYRQLGKDAASCSAAETKVRSMGGFPLRLNELEYELAPEIRHRFIDLPRFTWSPLSEGRTVMWCKRERTDQWEGLDEIIEQNARLKRAFFQADQILKQQRRRAAII
jgi:hypothetical protein